MHSTQIFCKQSHGHVSSFKVAVEKKLIFFDSGKTGFYYFKGDATPVGIPKPLLIKMLQYEQAMRSSQEYQDKFTKAGTDCVKLESVVVELQERTIAHFHSQIDFSKLKSQKHHADAYALVEFRSSRVKYKDDPDVNTLTDYFKYDKSREGTLHVNDLAPTQDIPLFTLDNIPFSLANLYETSKPVVIMAGSCMIV